MDKYKHTCPKCGQRIEYTLDYCGHQISCPSCHTAIVFPEAPLPTATQKLRLQRDIGLKSKKSWRDIAIIKALMTFSQWKVVGACLVPFAVVGGLLVGASYLRKAGADAPAQIPQAIATPVGADAWKRMTDMGQVEQAVQARLQMVIAAKQTLILAQTQRDNLRHNGSGSPLAAKQMADAEAACNLRQQQCAAAENGFREAFETYRKLGGQVDYNSQLPR